MHYKHTEINYNCLPFYGLLTLIHCLFLIHFIPSSHKELVAGFFSNARHLLQRYGEIHVSHKTGHPYDWWDLEHLASVSSLVLTEKVGFHKEDYPGYNQKRGDGTKCDKPFNLDPCCTFKFKISEAGSGLTGSRTMKQIEELDLCKLSI